MVDTAAARALRERRKNRNLPTVEIPKVSEDELARALQGIQEHLRMYEGDSGAPKERFVTLAELENAGIIKADVKTRFAYISQALGEDVAQRAGSTANPTLTTRSTRDTSRTSMTPGGGTGGTGNTTDSTATKAKLNDSQDVNMPKPKAGEFVSYNGSEYTGYPLFKRDNTWLGSQKFAKPAVFQEQATGPAAVEGLGYVWAKDDQTLIYTDANGTETVLTAGGTTAIWGGISGTLSNQTDLQSALDLKAPLASPTFTGTVNAATITATGNVTGANLNISNWDTAFGWGNHASAGYAVLADNETVTGNWTFQHDTIGDFVLRRNGTTGGCGIAFRNDDPTVKGYIGFGDDSYFKIWDGTVAVRFQVSNTGDITQVGTIHTPVLKDYSLTSSTPTSSSGAITFSYANGNAFQVTLTESITSITLSTPPPSGEYGEIVIKFVQDSTGSWTVGGWPSSVKWPGGTAPTITTTATTGTDLITLKTWDGGPNWFGDFSQDYQ